MSIARNETREHQHGYTAGLVHTRPPAAPFVASWPYPSELEVDRRLMPSGLLLVQLRAGRLQHRFGDAPLRRRRYDGSGERLLLGQRRIEQGEGRIVRGLRRVVLARVFSTAARARSTWVC